MKEFIYAPILKAMSSEFKALQMLDADSKGQILPLFEVTGMNADAKKFKNSLHPVMSYLDEVSSSIDRVWHKRSAMVDAFNWAADTTLENGELFFSYLYKRVSDLGIRLIPVIGYDRWENGVYKICMQNLEFEEIENFCIRLDGQAIEDAKDPEFFQGNLDDILKGMKLVPEDCSILIDFGDISPMVGSMESLMSDANSILSLLEGYGFRYFIVSGCSLPSSVNIAVKKPDQEGKVLRKDFLLWKALRFDYPRLNIFCGDYGVRGPSSNERVRNPHINGKIRYTINDHYYVARGHSMQQEDKGEQMWVLAEKIFNSYHYKGEDFSWGDARIAACKRREFKGNASSWISIDTNHHITHVLIEIAEFEETFNRKYQPA